MTTEQHIETLEGTERVEMFSDGVIAIIITILILEIHVPDITVLTNAGAWEAIVPIIPKLVTFLLSFVTVAIFWVNHHHFFYLIKKSDANLLWYNNHLLFWLAVIPFVTAFLGDYPALPLVVSLYGFVLFMGSLAFALMSNYVFFRSKLLPESVTVGMRKAQFKRSLLGVGLYAASALLAFVSVYISLALFVVVPVYYFLPQLARKKQV
ncbi:MAG: TMEM175 family protein [Candidatus Zambryskibacteria bacterium]|nr:TMEM175 family protein [Candidatus Zambryskibacteria bacterium]